MRPKVKMSFFAYFSLALALLSNETVFVSLAGAPAQAGEGDRSPMVAQQSTPVRPSADASGRNDDEAKSVRIAPTTQEQRFAEYVRIQHTLKSLSEDLRSPERVVSRTRLLHPERDPAAEITRAADLRKNLTEQRQRLLEQLRLPRGGEYEISEARPFRIVNAEFRAESHLQSSFHALRPRCPDLILGQVKASAFRHYHWNERVDHGYGTIVYWPLRQRLTEVPSATYNGDWSGETGVQFLGQLYATERPGFEFFAGAGVLQFTVPAPECDSVVYWGATGRVRQKGPWTFHGDKAQLSTEWVLYESPDGRGFPDSLVSSFMWFRDGVEGGTLLAESSWKTYDRQDFNRSFEAKAGVRARIYLGVSLGLLAEDGTVMTGFLDTAEFEHGVTYLIVPK
jgi:hypothetical protein